MFVHPEKIYIYRKNNLSNRRCTSRIFLLSPRHGLSHQRAGLTTPDKWTNPRPCPPRAGGGASTSVPCHTQLTPEALGTGSSPADGATLLQHGSKVSRHVSRRPLEASPGAPSQFLGQAPGHRLPKGGSHTSPGPE